MSPATLDLDTLRTLVVAADVGGYGAAAAHLGRTPSAISLQMKRLQQAVGASLFRKDGRGLALTEAGEITLRYARRIVALNDELLHNVRGASLTGSVRVGFCQDFAESVLPEVLSRFAVLYPLVTVEVRIEGNSALVDTVEQGQLDVALVIGHAERATARKVGSVELVWIAGRDFTYRPDQPLPLALFGAQCAFRKEAVRKLDLAGHAWRLAAVSASLAGLWASARGGLGVTVRSARDVPNDLVLDAQLFGLPRLDAFPVTLHAPPNEHAESAKQLLQIVDDVVASVLPAVRR
jgi:DNA-binding transcriptional LysR family regulator